MKLYSTLGFSLLLGLFIQAQSFTLKGKITDSEGLPIPYAIVSLADQESLIEASTDDEGLYELQAPKGNYELQCDAIGFDIFSETIELNGNQTKNIKLSNERQLEAVETIAEKPLYRFELDKKIYDVSQDITSKGNSLSDVLENVPSVSVDVDGTVNLRGSSNVKFLIDGKPTSMLGLSNSADVLRTIPASSIERIEVITNPSSRYEAEGTAGILNIIMNKNTRLGFNGNIQANLGYRLTTGVNSNLNWNNEKWGFFFNPGINYRENYGNNQVDMYYLQAESDDLAYTHQEAERVRSPFSVNATTGANYDISDKSNISASIAYRTNDMTNTNDLYYYDYLGDGSLEEVINRYEEEDETDHQWQANINFEHQFNENGKKLLVGYNVQSSGEEELADLNEFQAESLKSQQRSTNVEDQNRQVFTVDYINPFKKGANFELGYMGKFTDNTNDFEVSEKQDGVWNTIDLFTDGVGYEENINAFYTQYGNTFDKFSFQLGLRTEISNIKVSSRVDNSETLKDYTDLFPSAFFNYNFSENTQLQLNYSRRINRPRGRFLNPFFSYADERNTFRGNPDLDPSYTNSLELGMNLNFGKKFSLMPQLYYRNTQDDISVFVQEETISSGEEENKVLVAQPTNVGTNNSYGLELSFQYRPFNWWKMFGETTFFGYEQKGDSEVFDYNARDTSWRTRYSATFTLPSKIDFQLQANYRGPMRNGQSERKGVFVMNIGLAKDLFKNNATLSLNVRDLFNSRRMQIFTQEPTFQRELDMQWRERQWTLSFTYRFNQKKKRERQDRGDNGGGDEGMGF